MQLYRKPRERRVRIESEWFALADERMPLAFWVSVAHEVRPHGGTSAVLFSPLLVIRRTQSGFRSSSAE